MGVNGSVTGSPGQIFVFSVRNVEAGARVSVFLGQAVIYQEQLDKKQSLSRPCNLFQRQQMIASCAKPGIGSWRVLASDWLAAGGGIRGTRRRDPRHPKLRERGKTNNKRLPPRRRPSLKKRLSAPHPRHCFPTPTSVSFAPPPAKGINSL